MTTCQSSLKTNCDDLNNNLSWKHLESFQRKSIHMDLTEILNWGQLFLLFLNDISLSMGFLCLVMVNILESRNHINSSGGIRWSHLRFVFASLLVLCLGQLKFLQSVFAQVIPGQVFPGHQSHYLQGPNTTCQHSRHPHRHPHRHQKHDH